MAEKNTKQAKKRRKPIQAVSTAATGEIAEPKVNKSAAIREYLKAHKQSKPREVVAALKGHGIDVSPNMVSFINAKAKVKRASRRTKEAVADGSVTTKQSGNAAALNAALLLYKAARGQETQPTKVRQAFLLLVETLG